MLPGLNLFPFLLLMLSGLLSFELLGQSTIRAFSLGKLPDSEIFCGSTEVDTWDPIRTLKVNDLSWKKHCDGLTEKKTQCFQLEKAHILKQGSTCGSERGSHCTSFGKCWFFFPLSLWVTRWPPCIHDSSNLCCVLSGASRELQKC